MWIFSNCGGSCRALTQALLLLFVVGSMASCTPGTKLEAPSRLTDQTEADGTRYQTALNGSEALPPDFPGYLIFPRSTVLSSGQISDDQGGVTSLLLQTTVPADELVKYYRETLWYKRWEVLSQLNQEDVLTITFQHLASNEPPNQQVIVQIGSTHSNQPRELLILLSTSLTEEMVDPEALATDPVKALSSSGGR